jgi:hypothetical protein
MVDELKQMRLCDVARAYGVASQWVAHYRDNGIGNKFIGDLPQGVELLLQRA